MKISKPVKYEYKYVKTVYNYAALLRVILLMSFKTLFMENLIHPRYKDDNNIQLLTY